MPRYHLLGIVHLLIDKSLHQNTIFENTGFHKTKINKMNQYVSFYHNVKVSTLSNSQLIDVCL